MHLRFRHVCEQYHVYTFAAFVDDGESEDDLTDADYRCHASIGRYLVDTPESMAAWQDTIATLIANTMRWEGSIVGEITFDDGHEYEPPVECDGGDE